MASNPLLASITSVPPWRAAKSVPSRTARTNARAETESSTTKTRRMTSENDTTAARHGSNRGGRAPRSETAAKARRRALFALGFETAAMQLTSTNPVEPLTPAPTAAALVIGDEILSGKVQEANITVLAQGLRDLGILLRRVVIVMDD